jgi:hypothetical protein
MTPVKNKSVYGRLFSGLVSGSVAAVLVISIFSSPSAGLVGGSALAGAVLGWVVGPVIIELFVSTL